METGLLHTHHLVVILYMILLGLKISLIAAKRKNALTSLNGKTKFLHIVLASLLLFTGLFLMFRAPNGFAMFMIIKITAVLAGIGLGVVGVKKMNLPMAALSLAMFLYSYGIATTKHPLLKSESVQVHEISAQAGDKLSKGKAIYEVACLRCHGEKGDAGFQKAKNLKISGLSDDAKAGYIKMGKGIMPSYAYMKEEEVKAVVTYINTFYSK